MTVTKIIADSQERVLSELSAGQDRVVELNEQIAQAFKGIVPTEVFTATGQQPVPGLGELPEAAELVDGYFDFAAKVAETNRTFYKGVLAAWTPSI